VWELKDFHDGEEGGNKKKTLLRERAEKLHARNSPSLSGGTGPGRGAHAGGNRMHGGTVRVMKCPCKEHSFLPSVMRSH
jgi:hypothetical protein